ncbi:hypothetical protein ACHWQZ_G005636 [Mnemiopsis leidyi]
MKSELPQRDESAEPDEQIPRIPDPADTRKSGLASVELRSLVWTKKDLHLTVLKTLVTFGDAVEIYLPGVITQSASTELGVSANQEGLLGIILYLCLALSYFILPLIENKVSRRHALLISLYTSIIATVISCVVGSYWTLLVSRALLGICIGLNMSVAGVLFTEEISNYAMYNVGNVLGLVAFTLGGGWVAVLGYFLLSAGVNGFWIRLTKGSLVNFINTLRGWGSILLIPALLTYREKDKSDLTQDQELLILALLYGGANMLGRILGVFLLKYIRFNILQPFLSLIIAFCYLALVIEFSSLNVTIISMGIANMAFCVTRCELTLMEFDQHYFGSERLILAAGVMAGCAMLGAAVGATTAAFLSAPISVKFTFALSCVQFVAFCCITEREQLLDLSLVEARRDIKKLEDDLSRAEHSFLVANPVFNQDSLSDAINKKINPVIRSINKKMKKKIAFFKILSVEAPQLKLRNKKRKSKRSTETRRMMSHRYRKNRRERKAQALSKKVAEIVENKQVINLSSVEIPDQCYLYLAKGLNFVESTRVDKEDLLFDTQSFIRKLEWKAYFKQRPWLDPALEEQTTPDMHEHMRVQSTTHPDYNHPLLEQIKTRLLGWVSNTEFSTPANNLGAHEIRGRKLLLQLINDEKIFVTKADKGGATLILDYDTVVDTIKAEVSDKSKYVALESSIEEYMEETKSEIAREVLAQEASGNITSKDKTLITGLNSDNNMKHSPDYRPVPPKIWPLFKKVEEYNIAPQEGNLLLATLDVEALYPSINPDLAIEAMRHAFESDNTTTGGIKEALLKFTELSFKRSCVTFRDNVYKSKIGIPTGGCDSRQIADIFLHWLTQNKLKSNLPWDRLITLFLRYIDDCFLIWKGTARQFSHFVQKLNELAAHFGIKFGSWELGKEINFLDITLYLDASNKIQYKLYTKPTDARNYLRTDSFHPNHVFNSVAFSQMLRVANRNSREETRQSDLQQLKSDLHRSGHDMAKLDNLEVKVREQSSSSSATTVEETAHPKTNIVFPVQYFLELPQLKAVLRDIESDIEVLLGPTKIVTASKKGRSIRNKILRNSSICRAPIEDSSNWVQRCNSPRCLTCKHMCKAGDVFVVNDQTLKVNMEAFSRTTTNAIALTLLALFAVKTGEPDSCEIAEVNGFLKRRCADRFGGVIMERQCAFSEEKYTVYENFVSTICSNDTYGYQICGIQVTNNATFSSTSWSLCGFLYCGYLPQNLPYQKAELLCQEKCNNIGPDQRSLMGCRGDEKDSPNLPDVNQRIDGKNVKICDMMCDAWNCIDESHCNGYTYGKICMSTEDGGLIINPPHELCDSNRDCMFYGFDEQDCGSDVPGLTYCVSRSFSVKNDERRLIPMWNYTRCAAILFHPDNAIVPFVYNRKDIYQGEGTYTSVPYCIDFLDQTNCTDETRAAVSCHIKGYGYSTVSKTMVCGQFRRGFCLDGMDVACVEVDNWTERVLFTNTSCVTGLRTVFLELTRSTLGVR